MSVLLLSMTSMLKVLGKCLLNWIPVKYQVLDTLQHFGMHGVKYIMVDFWTSGRQIIWTLASSGTPKILIWDPIRPGPRTCFKRSNLLFNSLWFWGFIYGIGGDLGWWDKGLRKSGKRNIGIWVQMFSFLHRFNQYLLRALWWPDTVPAFELE